MAGVFSVLGIVQFVFRKNFAEVTRKFASNDTADMGVFNVWNFLFYLSIGLAIVLAVRSGGVIPVFSFIVVPPVAAMLITRNTGATVLIGLIIAIAGSVLGIYFSVQFDFPAGSSIVAMLGGLFVLASIVRLIRR
jgi:ABC-type Mn2+/Zn2+ transport system permease subunit